MNTEKAKQILLEVAEEIKLQHFLWVKTGEVQLKIHTESMCLRSVLRTAFSDTCKRSVKPFYLDEGGFLTTLCINRTERHLVAPSVAIITKRDEQIFYGETLFFKECRANMCIGFTRKELDEILPKLAVFASEVPIFHEVSGQAESTLLGHPKSAPVASWMKSILNN